MKYLRPLCFFISSICVYTAERLKSSNGTTTLGTTDLSSDSNISLYAFKSIFSSAVLSLFGLLPLYSKRSFIYVEK